MEIDEKTRYRANYVRVKIACRDVHRVPKTAEGSLGLYLYDFTFEREVQGTETVRTLSSGIQITEKGPDPKRFKSDDLPKTSQATNAAVQGGSSQPNANSSKQGSQQQNSQLSKSAPSKMCGEKPEKAILPNLKAKGVMVQLEEKDMVLVNDQQDKVHIPDTFDESDAESESLSEKLRKIDAYAGSDQGTSKEENGDDSQHIWAMEIDKVDDAATQVMNMKKQVQADLIMQNLSNMGSSEKAPLPKDSQEDKDGAANDVINSQAMGLLRM